MLRVYVAGDELSTLAHDFRQNGFAVSVDRYHLDQLNDGSPRVPGVVRFSPGRFELSCPLADQLTLQCPPLRIGQIGDSDLQHYSPLTVCQKPPTSEALHFVLQLRATTKYGRPDATGYGSWGAKKAGTRESIHVLAPMAFRAKVRRDVYRQANDPETEAWRACQRSSTVTEVEVRLILAAEMSLIEHAAADQTLNSYFGAPDSDEWNGSKDGPSGCN
jgi:hypothetical protein